MVAPPEARGRHIMVCGGKSAMLAHFRGEQIRQLVQQGFRVTAVGGDHDPETERRLAALGATYASYGMKPTGLNPFSDVAGLFRLWRLFRRNRPDVAMSYSLKPVVYGTLAAWAAGVPRRVALIEGLGYAFTDGGGLKRALVRLIAKCLLRLSLARAHQLIVMNRDDRAFFKTGYIEQSKIGVVSGVGVDLAAFAQAGPASTPPYTFLMIARLLEDKGVGDFVAAARLLAHRRSDIRCVLVGAPDPNPTGYDLQTARAWADEGILEYRGALEDVRPELAAAYAVVLPSHREGFPVTLMEAAAVGRAAIATDVPGCREAVVPFETGWLVTVRDPIALAKCMEDACRDPQLVERFGHASRQKAERDFDHKRQAQQLNRILLEAGAGKKCCNDTCI